jgi:hypothetical protein
MPMELKKNEIYGGSDRIRQVGRQNQPEIELNDASNRFVSGLPGVPRYDFKLDSSPRAAL